MALLKHSKLRMVCHGRSCTSKFMSWTLSSVIDYWLRELRVGPHLELPILSIGFLDAWFSLVVAALEVSLSLSLEIIITVVIGIFLIVLLTLVLEVDAV